MIFLFVLLFLVIYIIFAVVVYRVVEKVYEKCDCIENDYELVARWAGTFWPIAVPMHLVIWAGVLLVNATNRFLDRFISK
jgi:hypothetical protein